MSSTQTNINLIISNSSNSFTITMQLILCYINKVLSEYIIIESMDKDVIIVLSEVFLMRHH